MFLKLSSNIVGKLLPNVAIYHLVQGDAKFPNNRKQAEKQLEGLEKQFKRDKKFVQQYKQFMEDMIGNGYAEKCKIEGKAGRWWYLTHHGVYQPQKPGKLRVVFDCSA